MKTIVAGSRWIAHQTHERKPSDVLRETKRIHAELDTYKASITEVVSGKANGPDTVGAQWARANGIPVAPFPADWDGNGKAAGNIRNAEMAHHADQLIAFWDGKSKGTSNMIALMRRLKKPVTTLYFDKPKGSEKQKEMF